MAIVGCLRWWRGRRRGDVLVQKELRCSLFFSNWAGWECERIVRDMMVTDDLYYDIYRWLRS